MKIRTENLIVSVRILTGIFAFLIAIIVGVLVWADPLLLLVVGIAVYILFWKMGGIFAKMLERTNYEITDIDRDKVDEDEDEDKHLGKLLDVQQSAETPFNH